MTTRVLEYTATDQGNTTRAIGEYRKSKQKNVPSAQEAYRVRE